MALMWRVRTVWGGVAGAPYYTNMYFTSDSLNAGALAAQDDVFDLWESIKGSLVLGLTYTVESDVAEIDDSTGDLVGSQSVPTQTGAGVSTGELLPRASQALIQWKTGVVVGGRFLRGRTFVPGVPESLNGPLGAPTSGLVSGFQGFFQALVDSADSQLLVYSRTHATSEPVVTASCWGEWASLRSRRD